jgi:hypothetical protein
MYNRFILCVENLLDSESQHVGLRKHPITQFVQRESQKMKNNVIYMGKNGSLEIIGVINPPSIHYTGSVVILAKYEELKCICNEEHPDYCQNCITSGAPDQPDTTVMIFSYSIKGELKNPQRLLRSVRNKLMGSIKKRNNWQSED